MTRYVVLESWVVEADTPEQAKEIVTDIIVDQPYDAVTYATVEEVAEVTDD